MFWGLIEILGLCPEFCRVLFLALVVMVWVFSGVVGGGWFWGAEGLGLRS